MVYIFHFVAERGILRVACLFLEGAEGSGKQYFLSLTRSIFPEKSPTTLVLRHHPI